MSDLPQLMTVADLADTFGVSRQTIYLWISERGFPPATHRGGLGGVVPALP